MSSASSLAPAQSSSQKNVAPRGQMGNCCGGWGAASSQFPICCLTQR